MKSDIKLNIVLFKSKIREFGNQKIVAEKLGISEATLSYWLSGEKLPDYKNLKSLCGLFEISLSEAYINEVRFTHRFRKNRQAKVTNQDNYKVEELTSAITELIPYIEKDESFTNEPLKLRKPITSYDYYQSASRSVREILNDNTSVENILRFINSNLNTIIIPVLWGTAKPFCNALQITDKTVKVSFLYLNLNSKNEDIKFWLLHEAAHILAPEFDSDLCEDFSDELAGAVLFPEEDSSKLYLTLKDLKSESEKLKMIIKTARNKEIAPFTIYKQIEGLINQHKLKNLIPNKSKLFYHNSINTDFIINESFFDAKTYINIARNRYKSKIFDYIQEYCLSDKTINHHFIRRILNVSAQDAIEIYRELIDD